MGSDAGSDPEDKNLTLAAWEKAFESFRPERRSLARSYFGWVSNCTSLNFQPMRPNPSNFMFDPRNMQGGVRKCHDY
jgi:hypothetical protein